MQPTIGRVATRTIDRPRPAIATRPAREDGSATGTRPLGEPAGTRPPADRLTVLSGAPPADRWRSWLVTGAVTAVAAAVRFTGLGSPTDGGTPVFDEKHYVPQAWQMVRNGGVEDNPGFELIVHPPLGKQLIALGELAFGYNGVGWRAAAAVAGVLSVLLMVRVARRLTRSTLLGGIAGILLICDGLSHVQSRMGMLDAFAALFVLAAFATVLADRDDVRARMALVVAQGRVADSPYGPRLGVRWWRFGTGVLLGLGCAVKWSGAYWLVAFAVLIVFWDVAARRSAGVPRPWRATLVRDVAPAVWALALIPVLVYVGSWWAWFGSETAVDRFAADGVTGVLAPILQPLGGLAYYSGKALEFHSGLTTSAGNVHPWESKPWTWPMGLRPMLYYYASGDPVTGCAGPSCVSAVMLIGTPALWWPALGVLGFSLWRAGTRFDWRYGAVLVGYAAGVVPWLLNSDRQMYLFYMAPVVPFLVLATVLIMGEVLGRAGASRERRQTGLLAVGLWVGLVVANFLWLWPILVGAPITPEMWENQLWLPSWRDQPDPTPLVQSG